MSKIPALMSCLRFTALATPFTLAYLSGPGTKQTILWVGVDSPQKNLTCCNQMKRVLDA